MHSSKKKAGTEVVLENNHAIQVNWSMLLKFDNAFEGSYAIIGGTDVQRNGGAYEPWYYDYISCMKLWKEEQERMGEKDVQRSPIKNVLRRSGKSCTIVKIRKRMETWWI
ncbi:hypothetical protein Tco_1333056 [Tanacetum coccineum]